MHSIIFFRDTLLTNSEFYIGICFFFQAEDGIRDLVRSRGLGDVYKRQRLSRRIQEFAGVRRAAGDQRSVRPAQGIAGTAAAVSYTHLTLPKSDLV